MACHEPGVHALCLTQPADRLIVAPGNELREPCDRAEPANLRAQTLVTETSTRRAESAILFPIKTIDKNCTTIAGKVESV